jgi:acyl-coenzyme A thioesterase PaaI-like protein
MTDFAYGFAPHDRRSPVTDAWRPLWSRRTSGAVEIGFDVATCHCNGRGILHGGVLAALADNAMGLSLGQALEMCARGDASGEPGNVSGIFTTTLTLDYVGMARVGQRIIISPRVIHLGKGSSVVDALVTCDGTVIARANAAFRVLGNGIKTVNVTP